MVICNMIFSVGGSFSGFEMAKLSHFFQFFGTNERAAHFIRRLFRKLGTPGRPWLSRHGLLVLGVAGRQVRFL